MRRPSILWLVAGVMLFLSGCGWVQFPAGNKPRPSNSPRLLSSGSDALFVGASSVIVGKGDSVYGLSRRHRVSMRAIIVANGLVPPYRLRIGQRIVLPRGREYVVRRGDTLSRVSARYGVGLYSLARANNLKSPYLILVGQRLYIPRGASVKTSKKLHVRKGKKKDRKIASRTILKSPRVPPPTPRPPKIIGGGFIWPVKGKVVSGFGPKSKGLQNDGINISAPRGTPVRAVENGVVAYAGNELRGFGNLLLIKHSNGLVTAYAHNQKLLVRRGEKVKKGQTIASVGSTGTVSTPQLHFEIRRGKLPVNPSRYLKVNSV